MLTIYVYSLETDKLVGQHSAETNAECEAWADAEFGSNDFYWTYTKAADASGLINTTGRTLLIGSNNAYGWYALIDADGALIDCAADHDIGMTMEQMLADMAGEQKSWVADLDSFEGSWADGHGETAFEDWSGTDDSGRLVVESGEDAMIDVFGGEISARITNDTELRAAVAAFDAA